MNVPERDIITVLMDHREADGVVRPFYCVKCGRCVCEIVGNASMLVPGKADPVDMSALGLRTMVLCHGVRFIGDGKKITCDAKYLF